MTVKWGLMSEARLDSLQTTHLDDVVQVHRAAFPRSAMTKLGSEAVKRYYLWQLVGPHEMYASGAWVGEELVGFCFGGIHPTAISGFLATNKHYLAWRLMTRPWLVTNPLFRDRLTQAVKILTGKTKSAATAKPAAASAPVKRPYDILSIAVNPAYQGLGIGKKLLARATQQAEDNGFALMTLFVNRDNEQAIRFYERCGWSRSNYNGTWRGTMMYRLDQGTAQQVVGQGGNSAFSSA
jgi:ribosomal protein S18 acetylase RimI-like enzyme